MQVHPSDIFQAIAGSHPDGAVIVVGARRLDRAAMTISAPREPSSRRSEP